MYSRNLVIALALAGLMGCASNKAPDVSGNVSNALKQAGLNDVTVSQDRDKGVITLGGNVSLESDKVRAEDIAKGQAAGQVVADQIAVLPNGNDSTAKAIDSDLDKGIQANLDAAFKKANFKGIHHETKNGVVTLTGDLRTLARRADAERIAAAVPNVQQVVNEIDVKNQRATTSSADRSK